MKQKTLLFLTLSLLLASKSSAQVIDELPHEINGITYDYLPHNNIDYLPFSVDDLFYNANNPDGLWEKTHHSALALAGLVESAYFLNEEYQHECRLNESVVIGFYDILYETLDSTQARWQRLIAAQTDPDIIQAMQTVEQFNQLPYVRSQFDQYVAEVAKPIVECGQKVQALYVYVSNMQYARAFYEQRLLTVAPMFK